MNFEGVMDFLTGTNAGILMFITFDSPYKAYYDGQIVTGRVVVRVQKPKKFRDITVICKGEAHVEWRESRTTRGSNGHTRTDWETYVGDEQYFKNSIRVAGEMELQPGEYNFPFSFHLPQKTPSSFEGTYGYIRYTVKGVMERPWKFNHACKTAFTVVCPLDLNTVPRVMQPVLEQKSKRLCCLCCRSGPLELTVELPCSGYVPGQAIPFKVDIENGTDVPIQHINCFFQKEVTYHAKWTTKTKFEKVIVASIAVGERVEPNSSKTFRQDFKIPPVPPSDLQNCSIIDLEYVFQVEAVVGSRCHRNLSARIPITLGSIPLLNGPTRLVLLPTPSAPEKADIPDAHSVPAPGQSAGFVPPTDTSTAPSAPPMYPDLPPPSYEECVFGGQCIKEADDGEHTQGLTEFVPRYPVWNFNQPN